MKIDGTEGIFQIPESQKATDPTKDQDQGFQKIFDQTLNPGKPPAIGPSATAFVPRSAPVEKTGAISPAVSGAMARIEQFFDTLDEYRHHLAEPSTNLKALEAIVKKLDGQRSSLAPVANELPEDDALRTILNDSLVTASVEIFKFHRGDYLAP